LGRSGIIQELSKAICQIQGVSGLKRFAAISKYLHEEAEIGGHDRKPAQHALSHKHAENFSAQ
jgi:hypothetical protein